MTHTAAEPQKPAFTDPLLTVNEAAQLLKVSAWTVRKWLSVGRLRRVKVGARTLIRQSALQAIVVEE